MPTKKLKILMNNEAHFLFTGYSKYGRQVLSRLHDTGKYEIAELASYGFVDDTRCEGKWRFYANAVNEQHRDYNRYMAQQENEFGQWRFERTLLDFKPDIVFSIRDPWMMTFEANSPLRPYYHHCIMPTVDSHPQRTDWLNMFSGADAVFTYSYYGFETLKREGGGSINLIDVASPGCDLDKFQPVKDKNSLKRTIGFDSNTNIIGTIQRNQIRKLYPDLFDSFRKFIDLCYQNDRKDLADNTYLYAHCSYPDVGWDIPHLLKKYGVSRKVIFTYICHNCDNVFCSLFKGPRNVCHKCNSINAMLPNTNKGLSTDQLATVLNVFDVYIQYATNEGFGMPQVEAAACGLPIMTVNYSAMEDMIKNCHAVELPVERKFTDHGTNSDRALPDNAVTAQKMFDVISQPTEVRRRLGHQARKAVEKQYNWDHTAKVWENYFDSVQLTGLQGKWDAPCPSFKPIPSRIPDGLLNLGNEEFVRWILIEVMQEPEKLNTRYALKLISDLNFKAIHQGREIRNYTREEVFNQAVAKIRNRIKCEKARLDPSLVQDFDFIKFAHERERLMG